MEGVRLRRTTFPVSPCLSLSGSGSIVCPTPAPRFPARQADRRLLTSRCLSAALPAAATTVCAPCSRQPTSWCRRSSKCRRPACRREQRRDARTTHGSAGRRSRPRHADAAGLCPELPPAGRRLLPAANVRTAARLRTRVPTTPGTCQPEACLLVLPAALSVEARGGGEGWRRGVPRAHRHHP